jgi:hypothetical protein
LSDEKSDDQTVRKKIVGAPAFVRAWFDITDAAVPLIAEYVPAAVFDQVRSSIGLTPACVPKYVQLPTADV